jgi:hypothetical protein
MRKGSAMSGLPTKLVGRSRYRALLGVILASFAGSSLGQSFLQGQPGGLEGTGITCEISKDCVFRRNNDTVVVTERGQLVRRGEAGFTVDVIGRYEEPTLATISGSGNVIAVALVKETTGRRAFSRKMVRPDDLDRSYRIELYNPRSGSLIKSFDLGARAVRNMALSQDGQVLMVAAQDTERRAINELIAFNARSGANVLTERVDDADDVAIGSNGFAFAGKALILDSGASSGGYAVYNSRDPFSIAEYQVECSSTVAGIVDEDADSVGVAQIDDAATQQDAALTDAIGSGLSGSGVRLVERARLREVLEEIQLSTTGLTESEIAIDVGRLGVADYLVFGRADRSERNITVSTRLVSVERGEVNSTCTMICRDCENQDLYEGVLNLAEHWAGS